jgi:hypothetical protein
MSEQARSSGKSIALIVVFVFVALAGIGANYALDLYRRGGRVAATQINNDLRAAEQSLADLGAAEASYIAAGQNSQAANAWMNTAMSTAAELDTAIANLNGATTSADARTHYTAAAPLVQAITASDRKARGLIASGQALVAADVVLIEGADTVKQLKAELAAAREAEMAGFEKKAAQLGWIGLGANAGVMFVGLILLIAASRGSGAATTDTAEVSLNSREVPPAQPAPEHPGISAPEPLSTFSPAHTDLSGAADLCVDLGQVQNGGQLAALMQKAATVLEAKGLVLWVSESGGGMLRPAVAHGYSEKVLQRMGTLSVDGDNVTSLAFRTRQPQVVRGSIDGQGALAVPLITGSGCVGVLAAEVQGAKPGDARFAIARIIAAQLSTLVAPAVSADVSTEASAKVEAPRTASQL